MMLRQPPLIRVAIGGLAVGAMLLTACAHSQQAGAYGKAEPSGFLSDYSKLRPAADNTEATLVYVNPDNYTKIWLEPVQVWRGEKSDAKDLDPDDAKYISEYAWSRLDEELRQDYIMMKEAGPGVARVRVGITEAGKGIPVLDNLTAAYPAALLLSHGKKWVSGIQKFRKWETMVERIASLSGQEHDVVMAILFLATGLKNRQCEILKELARLKVLGEGSSGSVL